MHPQSAVWVLFIKNYLTPQIVSYVNYVQDINKLSYRLASIEVVVPAQDASVG